MVGTGCEVVLTAAQLEQIQEIGFEMRGRGAVPERAEVNGGGTPELRRDLRGNLRARKPVPQHQFHVRRQTQADFPAVFFAQMPAGQVPQNELRFEARAGEAIFQPVDGAPQVQQPGRFVARSEHAQQAAAQHVGARQIGFPLARPEQKNGGAVGNLFEREVAGGGVIGEREFDQRFHYQRQLIGGRDDSRE